jgi:hypothetical protein
MTQAAHGNTAFVVRGPEMESGANGVRRMPVR